MPFGSFVSACLASHLNKKIKKKKTFLDTKSNWSAARSCPCRLCFSFSVLLIMKRTKWACVVIFNWRTATTGSFGESRKTVNAWVWTSTIGTLSGESWHGFASSLSRHSGGSESLQNKAKVNSVHKSACRQRAESKLPTGLYWFALFPLQKDLQMFGELNTLSQTSQNSDSPWCIEGERAAAMWFQHALFYKPNQVQLVNLHK